MHRKIEIKPLRLTTFFESIAELLIFFWFIWGLAILIAPSSLLNAGNLYSNCNIFGTTGSFNTSDQV